MSFFGIDVSSENGTIDWNQVQRSGVQFAILRCHQRYGIESKFAINYKQAKKAGIPLGAYKYSYAMTVSQAKEEAKNVLVAIKGKNFQFPIFYDLEYESQKALGKEKIEQIALAFLNKIEKGGFKVAIYCNQDWYNNYISDNLKGKYDFWIASYAYPDVGQVKMSVKPQGCVGWQYTAKGTIPGIIGSVDLDIFYDNYVTADAEHVDDKPQNTTLTPDPGVTAEQILSIARVHIGENQFDMSHKGIIDTYNAHKPLARGHLMSYTDFWCDAFLSYLFIVAKAVDLIGGTECGVEEHVKKFQAKGIWIEDGTITPYPGDIIIYNWDEDKQPNDGYSDHIGVVETVKDGVITTIEGNAGGYVKRRQYDVGDGNIRGFARPKYGASTHVETQTIEKKSLEEIAQEVINGIWGNGADRLEALTKAGYDYLAVQQMVNKLLRG